MQVRRLRRVGLGVLLVGLLARPDAASARNDTGAGGVLERFPQEALDAFGADLVRGDPVVGYAVNGTLLPVPEANQLWQLYQDVGPERTGVLVRNARTLRPTGSFLLDRRIFRATTSVFYGGEWLHATDGRGRVFLLDRQNRLLEVDASTFAVRELGVLTAFPLPFGRLDSLVVAGMSWDRTTGRLLVLYGGPADTRVANRLTVLQEVDPATGAAVARVVRACTGPLSATDFIGDTYATAPLAEADAVYVPCQRDTFAPGLGLLSTSIVVRLPRAGLWEPAGDESTLVVGPPMDTALADSESARLAVLGWDGTVSVVDLRTMAVVGSFAASAASPDVGAGIDPATGRLYLQSDLGLGSTDLRATPVPPPTFLPPTGAAGQERVVTAGNRVFVLPGVGNDKPDRYTIVKATS